MKNGLKRMFLHAHSIAFNHPLTGEAMQISAPLPPELASFVAKLDGKLGVAHPES
jgi:23S rRNA pseudouridine955/2504/2580 synthase